MKRQATVMAAWAVCAVLAAGVGSARAAEPTVKLGVDVLRAGGFKEIAGKRVGLVVNPASVDSGLGRTLDVLISAEAKAAGVKLVALYGPEHGVYGDEYAGDKVADKTDPRTGLTAFSLYGKTRKPTKEMLNDVDVVIFDLQDVGSRSYTYVSTLRDVIAGCSENGTALLVLDRPNPLGGERIEGGMVAAGFESHVSYVPTPYVHGMTFGELAGMLRDTYNPEFKKLSVVKMQGWTREMTWGDTGLAWTPTSPHVPTVGAVAGYVATGILGELYTVSIGVGYTLPFEIVGAPWVSGDTLADAMNTHYDAPGTYYLSKASTRPAARGELKVGEVKPRAPKGIVFQPVRFKPFYGSFEKTGCQGVQLRIDPKTPENLTEINFRLMQALDAPNVLRAAAKRHGMLDKVAGSSEAREVLMAGGDLEPLFAKWRAASEEFRKVRAKYLLY